MRGTDSRHALADRRCERPVVNLQYSDKRASSIVYSLVADQARRVEARKSNDELRKVETALQLERKVRRIFVRGSVPHCRLRRRKFRKFDYETVHSEVYLNVVSIAPFSAPACPDCSQNIT